MCVYLYVFIKDGGGMVRERGQTPAQKMCQVFRETENERFLKLHGQNKQVGESVKGKHSQADGCFLSLHPLHYFHCQASLQRQSHSLATMILAMIMLIFIV